jgi:mersacidin/lichenicidin family type 2 lantibiotic
MRSHAIPFSSIHDHFAPELHRKENAMSPLDVIRAWECEEYRLSLSDAERALLPDKPEGLIEAANAYEGAAAGGKSPHEDSSMRVVRSRIKRRDSTNARRRHTTDTTRQGEKGRWRVRMMGSVPIVAALVVALMCAQPVLAANFMCQDTVCLIEAIHEANGNGEENSITLAAGIYHLTAADNELEGGTGLPSVTSSLTIDGPDSFIEREASAPSFRFFHVAASGTLTLEGITLMGGSVENNSGGAIFNEGTVTLITSRLLDNHAGISGGGIVNYGTAALQSTVLARNTAQTTGPNFAGQATSLGNNFIDDITGCSTTLLANDRTEELGVGDAPENSAPPSAQVLLRQDSALSQAEALAVAAPRFAYALNKDSNDINMYTVDPANGMLKGIGTVAAGRGPVGIAIHPSGQFVYVANGGSFDVYEYRIEPAGKLTFLGKVKTGADPVGIVVHPSGRYTYVTNHTSGYSPLTTSNTLLRYTNDAAGGLTLTDEIKTGTFPTSVVVTPNGQNVYTANVDSNIYHEDISMFSSNATTGKLTSLGTVRNGESTFVVTVHPSGQFLYAANRDSHPAIAAYTIDSIGKLTLLGTIPTDPDPVAMAADPSGRFLYAAHRYRGTISIHTIASTGKLTRIGAVEDAGGFPFGDGSGAMTIDPSGRFLYVANATDRSGYKKGNVAMYAIDAANGTLRALGTVDAGWKPAAVITTK